MRPRNSIRFFRGAHLLLHTWIMLAVMVADTVTKETVFKQFESKIYPLMTRFEGDSCVSCHDPATSSNLVLVGNAKDDFQIMVEQGYFALDGPDTILARLQTDNSKKRMPKGKSVKPWTQSEIADFSAFIENVLKADLVPTQDDESFPAVLLNPYEGEFIERDDNQFITYSQLRGKIKTIFGDDWVRAGKDLFEENVAFFNGADFVTRFNESNQATSSFLTGLDIMARDVGLDAYRNRRGPFAQLPFRLPKPSHPPEVPEAYRKSIENVYESILFRAPKPHELKDAYRLIKGIHQAGSDIRQRDYELGFKLTVQDPSTGLHSEKHIKIGVSADPLGLHQEWIDQSKGIPAVKGDKTLHMVKLNRPINFRAQQSGQRLLIHRLHPGQSVSLAAVGIQSTDGKTASVIGATHSSVMRDGAWKLTSQRGVTSFEHEKVATGTGVIEIPIDVEKDGKFEVSIYWRQNDELSDRILVEVYSDSPTSLAMPSVPAIPEIGRAHFSYDSSEDARPFAPVPGQFRFGKGDYVEVNNRNTDQKVTIGGLTMVPQSEAEPWLIDSREAEGNEDWKVFPKIRFRAYNQKGTSLHDDNQNKGERYLRFHPSSKEEHYDEGMFYRLRFHYPGKRDHETEVPVIVKASQSSPIIQVAHPVRAKTGASLTVDASGSFTVQHSPLQFHWEQTSGVPVRFDQVGPILKVGVQSPLVEEAAWTALVRALVRHPDFVFTKPPSIHQAASTKEKKTLQLVKIALDLVGRPPLQTELDQLLQGTEIPVLVDQYLDSQEFRDYYFNRIRLYLESQGTTSQDEPARLWSYVALNDLPFSEILTADYTVDTDLKKQARPAYHGQTGVLTTKGFIEGKPGLPHYNYAAQVSMLFLGYVFELPPEIAEAREGITALGTTDPDSACYSCHKILTPLALQRGHWTDDGKFRAKDENGRPIRADDHGWVEDYPFKGEGMEAFATQAVKKERFIRTMINTHFNFYFGRPMRYLSDERALYKRLWDNVHANQFKIRPLIRAIICSPEYLETEPQQQLTSAGNHFINNK